LIFIHFPHNFRAKQALQEAVNEFRSTELKNKSMGVHFQGIGEFSKKTLFADLTDESVLMLRKLYGWFFL
jgi:hypothetical protein